MSRKQPNQALVENSAKSKADTISGRKSIVHIDDNAAFLGTVGMALENEYDVIPCMDPNLGLKTVLEAAADLVIIDIEMGDSNGIEYCRQIRNEVKSSRIPIIVYTSHSSEAIQTLAFSNGATYVLGKSSGLNALKTMVEEAFEKKSHGVISTHDIKLRTYAS